MTIGTIFGSFALGIWITIYLTRRAKRIWLKVAAATLLSLATLVATILLIIAAYSLRDKVLFIAPARPDCSDKIEVYVTEFWQAGQTYSLNIGKSEFAISESFLFDKNIYNRKLRGEYCCTSDSCRVEFKLDNKDTTFFISPRKTKRLTVGSYGDGTILVGTDENKDFWVIM